MSACAKSQPPRERSELAGCDEVAAAERPTDPSEASGPKADTRTADLTRRSSGPADGPERSELGPPRDERSREEPAAARAKRACGLRGSRSSGAGDGREPR